MKSYHVIQTDHAADDACASLIIRVTEEEIRQMAAGEIPALIRTVLQAECLNYVEALGLVSERS